MASADQRRRTLKRLAITMSLWGGLLAAAAASGGGSSAMWKLGARPVPGPLPPYAEARAPALDIQTDVVYGLADGQALKLDFAKPVLCRGQSVPLIVYIHGGGWRSGDKSGVFDLSVAKMGFELGFAVASINYRLAPKYHFPAPINDCKLAVRFLRANAADLGIDPSRIAVAGGSAGGHLAALLATTDSRDGLDGPGLSGVSSRVAAAVDLFGPADLTDTTSGTTAEGISMLTDFLGCDPAACPDLALAASPIAYVTPDDPPILIVHGDKDTLVPYRQSEIFAERLRLAGNACALIKVRNGEHGLIPSPITATLKPSYESVNYISVMHIARFLEPGLYGDLNMDGRCDARDAQGLLSCLGLWGVGPQGAPAADRWNPLADLVPDGVIDDADLRAFARRK
jgi:acetyl esterase/lipase